jgi:hypothetical protein
MRAFFANGVDKMHIPWAVEGLPVLLHLSVFLFFGGLAIFLFNIDHAVFRSVIWWIGLFIVVYGLITVMPIVRYDSPYYSPLSRSAWFLYSGMNYVFFNALFLIAFHCGSYETWDRCVDLMDHYRGWMFVDVVKAAEETVSERSSRIDIDIFGWTIGVLGEDESLEKFFEAIPGLFNSKLVKHLERDFPLIHLNTFWITLFGFMRRTLSSNSITESAKSRRLIICGDIVSMIPCSIRDNLHSHFDQSPVSIEGLQAMARWFTHKNDYVAKCGRARVARNLVRMQERDDDWIALAGEVSGLPAHDLRDNIAHAGDNLFLATLIDFSRRAIPSYDFWLVRELTQFDIHNTLPRLQHDFCTLWNEIIQDVRNPGSFGTSVHILHSIRHLYIALHQGTDAAPTAFSDSTPSLRFILYQPSSYPLCDIADHRSESTGHVPVLNSRAVYRLSQPSDIPDASRYPPFHSGSTVLQQAEQAHIIVGLPPPSDPTIPGEIGDGSQAPAANSPTLPVHTSPRPTDASPPCVVATAPQDIFPAATLSHPLEETAQRDVVGLCTGPDIGENLSTTSTSCDASATSNLTPLPPVLSASIPASPPPSRVSLLPNAEFLALFSAARRLSLQPTMPHYLRVAHYVLVDS